MIRLEGSRSPVGQRGEAMPGFGVSYSGGPMERILVVEDDRAVQKALKRLFEAEGFAVEISSDGKSALEAYRAATPSAVVLDLRLPAMSGRDVCREIKQEAPALPVIILSAASDVSDKVLLLELGADDYVTKPFSPRELLARVRAALRRSTRIGDDRGQCIRRHFGGFHQDGSHARGAADRTHGPGIQDPEIHDAQCGARNLARRTAE